MARITQLAPSSFRRNSSPKASHSSTETTEVARRSAPSNRSELELSISQIKVHLPNSKFVFADVNFENALRRPGVLTRRLSENAKANATFKGDRDDCKSDTEQNNGPERNKHCRSGNPCRGPWLDAKLRAGGDDLSDRLQDLEDAARPDETGAALVFPDAGGKRQPRLRRAGCGVARRHVPQRRAPLGRVDEAVPGDHPVPGTLGGALDGDGRSAGAGRG